jgi:hypothetical protein
MRELSDQPRIRTAVVLQTQREQVAYVFKPEWGLGIAKITQNPLHLRVDLASFLFPDDRLVHGSLSILK